MNRAAWSRLGGCVFVMLLGLTSVSAHAQQKYTYSHASPPDASKYIRDHSIEVDDVPGHKVRIVEIQRTYTKDHPTIMGTKVVESWFRGFTDYGASGGPGHGYETWILEDGSRIYLETTFLSYVQTTATGSRRGTSHSTDRIVGGTGRFVSIRGQLSASVEFDSDPKTGYNRPVTQGEYWLANP